MICLDTNAIIAVLNSPHSPVRMRIDATIGSGAVLAVPSIVLFELWYGAAKSARPERNARRITDFLTGPIEVLPFEFGDAREAGDIRAALECMGTPVGPLRRAHRRTSKTARRASCNRERERIRPCAAAQV
jgi:tRNA(fMet)-specific endonuclease VapC